MAIIYLDSAYGGSNGDSYGSGANAGNIYKTLAGISNTFASGNTYRFKRGQTWNLTQPLETAASAAAKITVHAYYNSDGTDDAGQAKPKLSNVVDDVSGNWSNSGDSAGMWYTTVATDSTNRHRFYGLIGSTMYPSRDTDNDSGSWSGANVDVPVNDGDWVRSGNLLTGSPSGATKIKAGGNPCTYFGSAKPKVCAYATAYLSLTYAASCIYLNKPQGGVEIYDLDFTYCSGGIMIDPGSATTTVPNVWIHDNSFSYARLGIALYGGHATNTVELTTLRIYNNRFHMIGEAAINFAPSAYWVYLNGGTTPETGASYIQDNVFSYCCQGVSTGTIYMYTVSTTGGDLFYIQYNTVSHSAVGNYWNFDGMAIYLENGAQGAVVRNNFIWECAVAFESKPYNTIPNLFEYNVSLPLTAEFPAGREEFNCFIVPKNPDPFVAATADTLTTIRYCLSYGHRVFANVQRHYDERVRVRMHGNWAFGKNIASRDASAIYGDHGRIGSRVAPITDCHFYNFANATAKNWWSTSTTDSAAAPGIESTVGIGERAGTSDGTDWFTGLIETNNESMFTTTLYSYIGGSAPSNIETNYSRLLTNNFWHEIDNSIPADSGGSAGTLFNTLRKRRN